MHTLLIDVSVFDAGAWRQVVQAGAMPRLRRLLRLAAHRDVEAPTADSQPAWLSPAERWMGRAFGLHDPLSGQAAEQFPWGALAALAAGLQPAGRAWGVALPVHLMLGRDRLQLADPAALQLQPQEEQALLDAVLPLLDEQDWTLRIAQPGCWLLGHRSLQRVRTADSLRAVGRNAADWMPGGEDAAPWRRLLTEIQMVWLAHPVNEARQQAGLPEVNSLWLHGCGEWPGTPTSPFVDDARAALPGPGSSCGWLRALGLALPALPPAAQAGTLRVLQPGVQDAADAGTACARLDEQAEAALRQALREQARARLVLAGERGWVELELRRAGGWRVWRDSASRSLLAAI